MVVFGGTSGFGHAIVGLASDWRGDVFSFSRSATGTRDGAGGPCGQLCPPCACGRISPRRAGSIYLSMDELPGSSFTSRRSSTSSAHDPRIPAPLPVECVNARPPRLQPLLLGEGRSGEPHAGARGRPEGRFPAALAGLEFDGNWSDLEPCSLISVWRPDEGRSEKVVKNR
jgi:hypothetical protein